VPETAPAEQVPPPPPPVHSGSPGRSRVLVGGAALGLIALAVVLLTLPTGETGASAAPASAKPAAPPPPPAAPTVAPGEPPPPPPPVAPAAKAASAPTTVPPAPPSTTGQINATSLPANAAWRVDGRSISRRRLKAAAGRHILEVSAPGFLSHTDTVQVSGGQQFVWSPRLAAVPRSQPKAVASAPPVSPRTSTPPPEATSKRVNVDEVGCRQNVATAAWRDAFASCLRAAQAGSATAARNIALMFQRGNAVNRSDDSAAHWFAQAARNGDGESMYQLAVSYDRGRGLKKDPAAALDWYTRAANTGHADAAYAVGEAYEKGHLGAAKDKAKALEWYRKSAADGNKDAATKVHDLER
jgi:TPR repeat protein